MLSICIVIVFVLCINVIEINVTENLAEYRISYTVSLQKTEIYSVMYGTVYIKTYRNRPKFIVLSQELKQELNPRKNDYKENT